MKMSTLIALFCGALSFSAYSSETYMSVVYLVCDSTIVLDCGRSIPFFKLHLETHLVSCMKLCALSQLKSKILVHPLKSRNLSCTLNIIVINVWECVFCFGWERKTSEVLFTNLALYTISWKSACFYIFLIFFIYTFLFFMALF